MMRWLAAFLFLLSSVALAAPIARVEAVQAPVWLDRDGRSLPLAPDMELRNGDVVRTGEGARAYLLLAEGSRVKLGESARFGLHSRSLDGRKVFRAALDVAAGAFRYTTGLVGKTRPRDLAIRVGTATIGIRGTDVWGRTNAEGDLVALIEGRIEITRGGELTEMTQAMQYYDAPRGKAAEVKPLAPEVLKTLARQTEIEAGDGAARARGAWALVLGGALAREDALARYDDLREAGFAARLRPVAADGAGEWRYEVRLTGFASRMEAEAAAVRIKTRTGLNAQPKRRG